MNFHPLVPAALATMLLASFGFSRTKMILQLVGTSTKIRTDKIAEPQQAASRKHTPKSHGDKP